MNGKAKGLFWIVIFLVFAAFNQSARADWDFSRAIIDTEQIKSGGPPRDGIPAIMEPRFLDAADADFLSGDDMVLGLELEGESRAYPLRILSWHEIVNDTVADRLVLVSW